MIPLTAALQAYIQGRRQSTVVCMKATRRDGQVFRLTAHGRDIIIAGDGTYQTAKGFNPAHMVSSSDLSVDNTEIDLLSVAIGMTPADVFKGLWDICRVNVFSVDWRRPNDGKIQSRTGWVGQIKPGSILSKVELRGLWQALSQTVVEITQPLCRANFLDARCRGIDLTGPDPVDHTFNFTVATVVTEQKAFTDAALTNVDGWLIGGLVTWAAPSQNAGLTMEVKAHTALGPGAFIALQEPMPFPIDVGHTGTVTHGCLKRHEEDCFTRYNNVLNNQSEAHLSTNMDMIRGPS